MKILIATGIYPPDIGGPAVMLEALASSLEESGFEVKIITYSDRGGIEGGKIFRISRKLPSAARYIRYFFRMAGLLRRADIIYVTDVYSVGYFAYFLKKISGKKYVVRFAGDSAWEKAAASGAIKENLLEFQEKKYGKEIEKAKNKRKKILLFADGIICVSEFMKKIALKIGVDERKIKVIYNSADFMDCGSDDTAVSIIKNKYAPNGEKIILTACRLVPWKGIDGVIKAIPEIERKVGSVKFLVLGDGPEKENLKRLSEEKRISGKICFLGKIGRDDIFDYFKAADVFVLNSKYEGFSHTVLEAMKTGVPVVVSNEGGNPEVVESGKSGFLVEYNNESQIAEAISRILDDKKLAEALCAGAKERLENFNWGNVAGETIKIFKELSSK
ncbi:MAG: glycosyltransferase family 4 protein [Candidatus Pacebacteria bacterium]|nr:glycosyltransferase family 4 protein [Candidatus Paceibacterota bacterium]